MPRSQISFHADPDQVYQPAEDSFLLLKTAKSEVRSSDRVLEIGVGSGYVSTGLLSSCRLLVATDKNPHAASIAHNAGVQVVRADLAAGLCGPFDLILFNPPYLPTAPSERIDDWLELALDGGPTGRDVIIRFLQEVPSLLSSEGRVLLLISSLTGPEEVEDLVRENRLVSTTVAEERVEGGEILLILRLSRC
ncbi:MAG TPA: HemK2/MTQ2 family protein methyltransferase [Methanospirillum sp.]|uniref:HemK2/MTQ2 family protein methyltransferase n=1 Tax=Methanospirillum sp. TaxID=45200 RepID=UPI002CED14DA|nr:HemK2/MTQ2 family protein methyltransferase [Methanospirillum sp.]HWQ63345.1 HemK2/MTQ2 family protein methyltransferase [Methanospirillum sp.]